MQNQLKRSPQLQAVFDRPEWVSDLMHESYKNGVADGQRAENVPEYQRGYEEGHYKGYQTGRLHVSQEHALGNRIMWWVFIIGVMVVVAWL